MEIRVFPLYPVVVVEGGQEPSATEAHVASARCGCGDRTCKRVGKHPAVRWQSYEENEIGGPFVRGGVDVDEKVLSGGYGVYTGRRNSLFAVDVDVRPGKDGLAGLIALAEKHGGDLADTLTVATPSGGFHLYFELPKDVVVGCSQGLLAAGVDVRGEGGFVVGEGSPHRTGGRYTLLVDAPVQPAPPWLLRALQEMPKPLAKAETQYPTINPASSHGQRAVAVAKKLIEEHEVSIDGEGGSGVCFALACDLVRTELPISTLLNLMEELYAPRCLPPWSRQELEHKLVNADSVVGPERGIAPEGAVDRIAGRVPRASSHVDTASGRLLEHNCARPDQEVKPISQAELSSDLHSLKEWDGVIRFDDLRKWVVTRNAPIYLEAETGNITDEDFTCIRQWFERRGKGTNRQELIQSIKVVARENRFNPVLDYLNALPKHTGPSVLAQFAERVLGNTSPLAQKAIVKTLIASVRRMRYPGTKVDTVLILKGSQGAKKSTCLEVLFGKDFTKSQMCNLDSKDASLGLRGMWCVELAEIEKLLLGAASSAKEFVSRSVDNYRAPYASTEAQYPRMCVFVGTTNDSHFLEDMTGNRRYWVVEVLSNIDLEWVRENRDAIWSEVCALEEAGVPHWFEDETEAKAMQEPYEGGDPWEEAVRDYCAGREQVSTAAEVYKNGIARGDEQAIAKMNRTTQNRVARILMDRLGCKRKVSQGKRFYEIPEALATAEPSAEERERRKSASARSAALAGLKALSSN